MRSLIDSHSALNVMPIEPSSRAGFTITGNCRSCDQSRRPRCTLAKYGVRMPWKAKIFLASDLFCARCRPAGPAPV